MIRNALPQSLIDNPRPDQWVSFEPDRTVALRVGKVELGQGVLTALRQIAAEELDLPPGRLRMIPASTAGSPSEGMTAGSLSVEVSGGAVRLVCAEIRGRALAEVGRRLAIDPDLLTIDDGKVSRDGLPTGDDYWSLSDTLDLATPATGSAPTKRPSAFKVVGRTDPRLDLPAKVFGAPFVHDLAPEGMRHARVLHRPWPGARLESSDADLARIAAPGMDVVRERDFAAFLSDDETACVLAVKRAWERAVWTGGEPLAPGFDDAAWLLGRPTLDRVVGEAPRQGGPATSRLRARYSRPYLAHASIGPSCAVALMDEGRLQVWTHSQGIGPLRGALARILGRGPDTITVHHGQGAGCYGHNGADDVALDAALLAIRRPGRPVRVLWLREDEMTSSPFGPAGIVELEAGLGHDGRPVDWTLRITSPVHAIRPGMASDGHMLSASAIAGATPPDDLRDVPDDRGSGAARNALALYDLPGQRIVHRMVPRAPVRTSAMRGLGALANVFAIESFMDELAAEAGDDPVAYRLSLLSDPRARRVVERAAAMSRWSEPVAGESAARGFAFSRYKNHAAYAALVIELEVGEEVRLRRAWAAVDAGLVINPDGARNQVEGGIVQAASWTLKEQVRFEDSRVATATWDKYPILRFSEVPEIEIDLVGDPDDPPLGLGEVVLGPTAAAIANAVHRALGLRIRDLPITRERLIAAVG